MRTTNSTAVKLLAIAVVAAFSQTAARAAEGTPQWEYRVLTKVQILDLGKKDLAAGLNKLGDDGWELAAFDAAYIFKRPKAEQTRPIAAKLRLKIAEADVGQQRERVQWSKRMVKKGFIPENQLKDEERLLRELELVLEEVEADIKSLRPEPKKEMELIPMPKK
jgi:hypothetical protein